jgi:hypothetical protein
MDTGRAERAMAKLRIYQFEVYGIRAEQIVKSKRWGTKEAIVQVAGGRVLEDTGIEVDESVVPSDIHGLTPIGFDPHPRRHRLQNRSKELTLHMDSATKTSQLPEST